MTPVALAKAHAMKAWIEEHPGRSLTMCGRNFGCTRAHVQQLLKRIGYNIREAKRVTNAVKADDMRYLMKTMGLGFDRAAELAGFNTRLAAYRAGVRASDREKPA